jgi:hypothetical protein
MEGREKKRVACRANEAVNPRRRKSLSLGAG